MTRADGRAADELRPIEITPGFISSASGSVLFEIGSTRLICTAMVEESVPGWMRGRGTGWVTAEYGMLPGSTSERKSRDASRGKQDGRTVEIQRLIGRSLRSVVDFAALGERTVWIDCDVIQADGGTRCAAICGGYLALHLAMTGLVERGLLRELPLSDSVAAVSVGIVDGEPLLDLAVRRGLAGRGRHERRHRRQRRTGRGAGDGRAHAVRAGVARPAAGAGRRRHRPRSPASRP